MAGTIWQATNQRKNGKKGLRQKSVKGEFAPTGGLRKQSHHVQFKSGVRATRGSGREQRGWFAKGAKRPTAQNRSINWRVE